RAACRAPRRLMRYHVVMQLVARHQMGWERRGQFLYYFRATKAGGRRYSTYFGRGAEAQLASQVDELHRQTQRARRAAEQQLRQRWRDADEAVHEFISVAQLLAHTALHLAGYHRPQRGPWRRRRQREDTPVSTTMRLDQLPPPEYARLQQV